MEWKQLGPCAFSRCIVTLPIVVLAGCDADGGACVAELSMGEVTSPLIGASADPGVVRLTDELRRALVTVAPRLGLPGFFCTGTMIAPEWILTAAHCAPEGGIVIGQGDDLRAPDHTFESIDVRVHPTSDVALIRVPGLGEVGASPFLLRKAYLGDAWLGAVVQLAGFGEREEQALGALRFVASHIAALEEDTLVTDGEGLTGACLGDSGGPMLTLGPTGQPEVAGVLASGAASCVGTDRYVRVDRVLPWLQEVVGALPSDDGTGCRLLSVEGVCQAGEALWCDNGQPRAQPCAAAGATCGWDHTARGFRCVASGDGACQSVGSSGNCVHDVASFCNRGAVLEMDCASCGQVCRRDAVTGRATCVAPPAHE